MPDVFREGQGGLLDVALHPDFVLQQAWVLPDPVRFRWARVARPRVLTRALLTVTHCATTSKYFTPLNRCKTQKALWRSFIVSVASICT
ncbi:MAG: hypothetical protein IPG06_22350 [Haliea sp.]|nr:hypothetical protein [Haliea sp.]